jgi:hypothetical protein
MHCYGSRESAPTLHSPALIGAPNPDDPARDPNDEHRRAEQD